MSLFPHIKTQKKACIGLYSVGLAAYWNQFEFLEQRLKDYGCFIAQKMQTQNVEVFNFGMVDDRDSAVEAGEFFNANNVDLIFCHCATYCTSDVVLALHQRCKAKSVFLNLQPAAQINYEKTSTGEWLAFCGACPAPEFSNAFERAGLKFRVINGLLGNTQTPSVSKANEDTANLPAAKRAWNEINEYLSAANVCANLANSRFGFLGNSYSGMLDMYSDFTQIQASTGIQVDIIEMCDLMTHFEKVTQSQIDEKLAEILKMFTIADGSSAEKLAKKPTQQQLEFSCKVAAAQEMLVRERNLDSIVYYYHGAPNNQYEQLQSGFIVGHSLLSAKGVACAGEGDLKTAVAMKICDLLKKGGSYCEIVTADYVEQTILIGHDGPFHLDIAREKPILRAMDLYHGKKGAGISVEAKVKIGPTTTLGLTQLQNGKLRFISSQGMATNGKTMQIGNTQTPISFGQDIDDYMTKWFALAPTHHCALSVGHNNSLFEKVSDLLGIELCFV